MKRKKQILKLYLLGLTSILLLNFPILSIFNSPLTEHGTSTLYTYIFGIWFTLLLIVSMINRRVTSETKKETKHE